MYKKTVSLAAAIFMIMMLAAGCSGSDGKPAESTPEEAVSYDGLIFDTSAVHTVDVSMSADDRADQLAHPTDKTKYKVDASGVVIKDMGFLTELKESK